MAGDLLTGFQIGIVQQHGELVTGKARQAAARTQAVTQAPGQADQQFVAGLVAKAVVDPLEAVVDPLEIVDIHQQQADGRVAVAGETLVEVADERRAVTQVGQVVGVGQPLDALLRELGLGDVFVDADVVGQLAVVTIDLGDRQLPPVGFEVLAAALEFALPAVALGQARRRIEQQFAEVLQGWQLGELLSVDFFGAVLGDGGEAWVDVFHHTVAVDQQEGVGALLDRSLEQVQGAGGDASIVVVDDLGELIGQFAGKGDFVRLPGAGLAGLFQAEHAHHLAIDTDTGIEHGVDVARPQDFGHLAGARVANGVMGIDGAAGVQGFQIVGELAGVDHVRQYVFLAGAMVGGDRHQTLPLQVPDAGAVDLVDITGTAGDQFGRFLQGVARTIALAGQAQDQVLLGAHPVQVLQLLQLGALVEFQSDLQATVLSGQIGRASGQIGERRLRRLRLQAEQAFDDQQVTA